MLLLAGALAAGCSSYQGGTVLAPVGPIPSSGAISRSATGQPAVGTPAIGDGSLVVYSAYEVNPDFDDWYLVHPQYTDYQILTETGKPVKFVHNNSGSPLQDPARVELPAGKYRVEARANGYGRVTVPVMIAPHQLTTVNLENDVSPAR